MPRRRKKASDLLPERQEPARRTSREREGDSRSVDQREELRALHARQEMAAPLRAQAAQQLSRQQGNQYVMRIQRQDQPAAPASKKLPSDDEKLQAIKDAERALSLGQLLVSFDSLDLNLEPPPAWLTPPTAAEKAADSDKPPWKLKGGPEKPKKASEKDLARALAIATCADRVPDLVLAKLAQDFHQMKAGEKAALIVTSVAIAGPALAAAGGDPQARDFMLKQLDGKEFKIPGLEVPTTVKFMTGAKEKGMMVTVDLGKYIWK